MSYHKQVALIAAGRIGKMYGQLLAKHFPDYRLKTVVDKYQSKSDLEKEGIKAERVTADLDVVLDDEKIDRVIVAASTPSHITLCKKLAQAGKHILCEKPLSFDSDEITQLSEHIKKTDSKLQVAYVRRFDPDYAELKKRIEKGVLGDIHMIKIVNRDPIRPDMKFAKNSGGIFLDFLVHDFDIVHFLTGQRIKKVYAMGECNIEPELKTYNDYDTVMAMLRTENDILVHVDCSRETLYGYDQRIEVFGSKCCLRAENKTEFNIMQFQGDSVISCPPKFDYQTRYYDAFVAQIRSFFDCIDNNTPHPAVTAEDAALSVKVAIACAASCEQEQPVSINY